MQTLALTASTGYSRDPCSSRKLTTTSKNHSEAVLPIAENAIPWDSIETVLLDMDGTLLDLHYDNHFWLEHLPQTYAAKNGLSVDDTQSKLGDIFRRTLGTLDFYCVDYWQSELDLDVVALKSSNVERIQFLPYARDFLLALRQLPHRPKIVMATNAHRKVFQIKDEKLGLAQYFDAVYCANEFFAPKESSAYWYKLQEQHPFNPLKTLFVDDNQNVLRAAKDYGIKHLVLPLNPDTQKPTQSNRGDYVAIESLKEITPNHD